MMAASRSTRRVAMLDAETALDEEVRAYRYDALGRRIMRTMVDLESCSPAGADVQASLLLDVVRNRLTGQL
jgi:YD repeat-containing protein